MYGAILAIMEKGYDDKFDVTTYMVRPRDKEFIMKCLDRFFSTVSGCDDLKILDCGCGPSLDNSISAAPKAAEIVMADYCKPNRDHMKEWLKGAVKHDLSNYIKYSRPNIGADIEKAVAEVENELRSKTKAVVWCDFTKDKLIEEGYEGPYDVVMSFLCLEDAAGDSEEYVSNLKRILSLLQVNGTW